MLYLNGNQTVYQCVKLTDFCGFNCDFKKNKIERTWTVNLHDNLMENKQDAGT